MHPPSVVVRLPRALDGRTVELLRSALEPVFRPGLDDLVFDLADVDSIDTSGLAWLVHCRRRATEAGGDLRLEAATTAIATRLRTSGLDRLLLADVAP